MVDLQELLERFQFETGADRIGPDTPFTHWRLYFKRLMTEICQKKFRRFGEKAEFRPGAYAIVCSKIEIGDRVVIRPGTMLFADPRDGGAGISIEDGAMLGSGVQIYTLNHRFDNPDVPIIDQGHSESQPVVLKKGCWVGANAILLPGVEIGENAVVGAGSVVTKSIPDRVVAVGNPARVIRRVDSK